MSFSVAMLTCLVMLGFSNTVANTWWLVAWSHFCFLLLAWTEPRRLFRVRENVTVKIDLGVNFPEHSIPDLPAHFRDQKFRA